MFYCRTRLSSPLLKPLDSDSLSNLCISRKSEFTGAGLIAFINLHNSEMFDWTLAFPPSKEHFNPLCNSNTSNTTSFNGISLQTSGLRMVITIPDRARSQPETL